MMKVKMRLFTCSSCDSKFAVEEDRDSPDYYFCSVCGDESHVDESESITEVDFED